MKRFISLLLIIVIMLSACSADINEKATESTENVSLNNELKTDYMRAVWLSYREISMLSNGKTKEEFKNEAINLAANLLSFGINTVIIHAIPFCDSFYDSSVLPKSKRLDGKIDYDVFGVLCELCSKAGINVQAWINPYRVSASADLNAVFENPTVKKLYDVDKDNLIITENEIYLNPSSVSAQRLIISEARELIEKYDICAIHIDDYFYPDMSSFPDKNSYIKYKKSGGTLSCGDWRRENVNTLISSLHSLLHAHGKSFAVSPAPDIEKNYNLKYADISLWLENGWADYIIPQIYFGFRNETMPFEKVVEYWIEKTNNMKTKLVIGLAAYKCGEYDQNAGNGKNEWLDNDDIISRQIRLISGKNTIYGVAFFSYSYIFDKNIKKITKKELQIIKNML